MERSWYEDGWGWKLELKSHPVQTSSVDPALPCSRQLGSTIHGQHSLARRIKPAAAALQLGASDPSSLLSLSLRPTPVTMATASAARRK